MSIPLRILLLAIFSTLLVSSVLAEAVGRDRLIGWMEGWPGRCILGLEAASPFVFAAVGRHDGNVTFSGAATTRDCPQRNSR